MANKTYYFDLTPAAAGFGTLTGAWNTTTANWTESSAGASGTNVAVTFDDTDTAQFGATGTSGAAGTATISGSVTTNVVRAQNLAGTQTIAGGTLVMAGVSPAIDASNAGGMALSTQLAGTNGCALTGTTMTITNSSNTLSTTEAGSVVSVGSGLRLDVNPVAAISSIANFSFTGRSLWFYTNAYTYPRAVTMSGPGAVRLNMTAASGLTFTLPAGSSLTGMNRQIDPGAELGSFEPSSGIVLYTTGANTNTRWCYLSTPSLPARMGYYFAAVTRTVDSQVFYTGPGATYADTRLDLIHRFADFSSGSTSRFYANNSDSNPLIIGGGLKRFGVSANCTFAFGGSSTADNTISGSIDGSGLGTLAITKIDNGKWVFSGANNYTGTTTISAGILGAASSTALGSATGAVTLNGTGQLLLQGGVTVNKSSGAFTLLPSNPILSIGDNTLQTGGITLGGTTTFTIATGDRLAIANSGAITDGASTFGITKAGGGELALGAFSNTYDGTVSVSAGTLAFNSSGALGTGAVQVTATLKYAGTGETVSRAITLVGSAPSLEAAGTNAVTFSNLAQDSTTKTLTLKGANTGANTVTVALSNSSNPLSLAKEGAGKWVATGALSYTGTTTVSGGTLRVQTANSNTTSGAVTIGASGTVELVTNTLASAGSTSGEVLGTSSVTVNGGTIKTRGGTTQKGQVRYGGNLTFESGSSLYLGAAA